MTTFRRDRRFLAAVAGLVLSLAIPLLVVMFVPGCKSAPVQRPCDSQHGPSQTCPTPGVTP